MDIDNTAPLSRDELVVAAIHMTEEEFVAAGIILWLRCVPDEVRQKYDLLQWLPFCDVDTVFSNKGIFDTARRWQHVSGKKIEGKDIQYMLQYVTLCGRNMDEVDWEKEWFESRPSNYVRKYPEIDSGMWTTKAYVQAFTNTARQVVNEVMDKVTLKENQSISAWWARRSLITPTGSSSLRGPVEKLLKQENPHLEMERPNKKVVASMLDDSDLLTWLKMKPKAEVRCSTKHEPGRKNRPLHAADDISTAIASFASAGMEQSMDQFGMDSRQTPQDLGRWMEVHYRHEPGVWVSTDYSRFFSEHHWWEQCLVNLFIADYWCRNGLRSNSLSKAYCALWTSLAVTNRYTDKPKKRRHAHGLFSGQRDTARDNTLLHCIYSRIVLSILDKIALPLPLQTFYCGDDEDALCAGPIVAATYVKLHKCVGWHLQDIKQLVAYRTHEYLRYMLHRDLTPIHPLSSMLAVLVTGNWYTADATWLCGQIQALTSQAWIILQRGANHKFVERLIVILFNRMFTAIDDSGKKIKLEWYDKRPCKNEHRLWAIEGQDKEQQQATIPALQHSLKNSLKGSVSLYKTISAQFPNTDPGELASYCKSISEEVISTLLLHDKKRADNITAIDYYGPRRTVHKTLQIPEVRQQIPWFMDTLNRLHTIPITPDRNSVLARHGISPALFDRCGGIRWLLDNDQLELAGSVLTASNPPKTNSSHLMYDFPSKFWGILKWM